MSIHYFNKDVTRSQASSPAVSSKISLFYKAFIMKACFSWFIVLILLGMPSQAHAGFFDFVGNIFSTQTQASDTTDASNVQTDKTHNSQTVPLLESSLTPDLKASSDDPTVIVVADQALEPTTGPLGPAGDLAKYATTGKINVYKVQKGDTLKSIAKKFKVSEDVITYSNSDLKKSDLLVIGQNLVILQVKSDFDKANKLAKEQERQAKLAQEAQDKQEKVDKAKQDKIDKKNKTITVVQTPVGISGIPNPVPVVEVPMPVVSAPIQPDQPQSNGQPKGTIIGGYIWPFPKGVGRVSQGLHADQAHDFAAPKGTDIYAIQDGTVLIADDNGYNGGYGLYVVIDFNDGRQAILGHMSKVLVEAGQVVKQGDLIGKVGSTGHSTGPHVHIGFHGDLGNPYTGLKVNARDLQEND